MKQLEIEVTDESVHLTKSEKYLFDKWKGDFSESDYQRMVDNYMEAKKEVEKELNHE